MLLYILSIYFDYNFVATPPPVESLHITLHSPFLFFHPQALAHLETHSLAAFQLLHLAHAPQPPDPPCHLTWL